MYCSYGRRARHPPLMERTPSATFAKPGVPELNAHIEHDTKGGVGDRGGRKKGSEKLGGGGGAAVAKKQEMEGAGHPTPLYVGIGSALQARAFGRWPERGRTKTLTPIGNAPPPVSV